MRSSTSESGSLSNLEQPHNDRRQSFDGPPMDSGRLVICAPCNTRVDKDVRFPNDSGKSENFTCGNWLEGGSGYSKSLSLEESYLKIFLRLSREHNSSGKPLRDLHLLISRNFRPFDLPMEGSISIKPMQFARTYLSKLEYLEKSGVLVLYERSRMTSLVVKDRPVPMKTSGQNLHDIHFRSGRMWLRSPETFAPGQSRYLNFWSPINFFFATVYPFVGSW